jgi:hypothetical protein
MPDREELQRELERRDEEILRLRDLLVTQDAELGEVRGRLRELEDVSRLLMDIALRIHRRVLAVRGGLRRLGGGARRNGA